MHQENLETGSNDRIKYGEVQPKEHLPGQDSNLRPAPNTLTFRRLKDRMNAMALPTPISLGALLVAGFLLFPAYRGFRASPEIHQLHRQVLELESVLNKEKLRSRSSGSETALFQQRVLQSLAPNAAALSISPVLALDGDETKIPDLIKVNFTQSDRAVLVFARPRQKFAEIRVSILDEEQTVWNQTVSVPADEVLAQSAITFVLDRSLLPPGTYQLVVVGDPRKEAVKLARFDLSILR